MSSDPRVHKPRLPKAYTDQQLTFLRRYLSFSLPTFLSYWQAVVYQNLNDDLKGPYVEMPKNSLWSELRISSCALVSLMNSMV